MGQCTVVQGSINTTHDTPMKRSVTSYQVPASVIGGTYLVPVHVPGFHVIIPGRALAGQCSMPNVQRTAQKQSQRPYYKKLQILRLRGVFRQSSPGSWVFKRNRISRPIKTLPAHNKQLSNNMVPGTLQGCLVIKRCSASTCRRQQQPQQPSRRPPLM